MNVGLPSETIKNAAIRIKELERENAELREQVDAYVASGVSWNGEWVNTKANKLERENAKLREALKEISTTAHCIAKAGPLNTPTLQDAWGKFMAIDAMATKALSK